MQKSGLYRQQNEEDYIETFKQTFLKYTPSMVLGVNYNAVHIYNHKEI